MEKNKFLIKWTIYLMIFLYASEFENSYVFSNINIANFCYYNNFGKKL